MLTVGERLAGEFNQAFLRGITDIETLSGWMLTKGIPAHLAMPTELRFAVMRVHPGEGYFEPDTGTRRTGAAGRRMAIIPEGVKSLSSRFGDLDIAVWHHLDDMVAFDPVDPDRWWRRVGGIDVLGQDALRTARDEGTTLRLFRNPLTWLKGGAEGVCLVDRAINPAIVFRGIGKIQCEDDNHARWLDRRACDFARKAMPEIAIWSPAEDPPSRVAA